LAGARTRGRKSSIGVDAVAIYDRRLPLFDTGKTNYDQ